MGTNFIQYNSSKGFWISQEYMRLCFYYIEKEMNRLEYVFLRKEDLVYNLNFHIDGFSPGSLSLDWANYLEPSEINVMVRLLKNLSVRLLAKGKFISISELQTIGSEDEDFKLLYSRNPFPTAELIKIIDALIQMLEGTWESTNYSMDINYRY